MECVACNSAKEQGLCALCACSARSVTLWYMHDKYVREC